MHQPNGDYRRIVRWPETGSWSGRGLGCNRAYKYSESEKDIIKSWHKTPSRLLVACSVALQLWMDQRSLAGRQLIDVTVQHSRTLEYGGLITDY